MYYKEQLVVFRDNLSDHLEDLYKELEKLPEGKLCAYSKNGRYYYYQRLPAEGKRKKAKRFGITKDSDTLLALVRKKYVETAIENIRNDIAELDRTIHNYNPVGEEAVMLQFFSKYPELETGIYYGHLEPKSWVSEYEQPIFYEGDLKSVSAQGERMRSGGEMYIASRLDHFGIPYRYEDETGIPDLDYAPDFKILRPRDRKIIYWEHFGKVNDYNYIQNNLGKVREYIDYGIKPWDNLIMTFNNEKGGFDGRIIDALIDSWLL